MSDIKSYRDLEVWQAAVDLAVFTYEATRKFPRSELFGLTAHTRKTGVSIPSNIAKDSRSPIGRTSIICSSQKAGAANWIRNSRSPGV